MSRVLEVYAQPPAGPPTPHRHRPRLSWTLAVLGALFLPAAVLRSQASPITSPKRVVNGYQVDLTPLFHWWTNHHGARPFASWVHVAGEIASTNSLGWVVSGHAERSTVRSADSDGESPAPAPVRQFILKNPPAREAAEFQRLHAQLQQATTERARFQAEAANAKNQEKQASKSRNRNVVASQARQVEQADQSAIKNLDQQISDLKKKLAAYPNQDHFAIDALALDTGTQYSHLPVFDHGVTQPGP